MKNKTKSFLIPVFIVSLITIGLFMMPSKIKVDNTISSDFFELPAVHLGRVKPLDTIARTSLVSYKGRPSFEYNDEKVTSHQWFLDTVFNAKKADKYPIFRVNHPGILTMLKYKKEKNYYLTYTQLKDHVDTIQQQAEYAESIDSQFHTSFQRAIITLKNQIVSYIQLKNTIQVEGNEEPLKVLQSFKKIAKDPDNALNFYQLMTKKEKTEDDQLRFKGILDFVKQFNFQSQYSAMLLVPKASKDQWKTLGDGAIELLFQQNYPEVVLGYAGLSTSVQAGKLEAANNHIRDIKKTIKSEFPQYSTKLKLELWFNKHNLFSKSILLYVIAFGCILFGWWIKKERFLTIANYCVMVGLTLQTSGLIIRMILQGRPPVTNLYSSALFVGWVGVILTLLMEKRFKNGISSIVGAVVGILTLTVANRLSLQGDTIEMMQAVLDSNFWLLTHVITITVGYSGAFVAGILAHIYIFKGVFTKSLTKSTEKSITQMVYGIACFTLLFSFVGTVLGGIWADQSWGRFWGWDPKENGALLIVIWFAIILHARLGGYIQSRGLMLGAVFGNMVTSFSWFGVNMLGVGLHSYGFMERAFFWLILFMFSQALVIWIGALPKAHWKSFKNG